MELIPLCSISALSTLKSRLDTSSLFLLSYGCVSASSFYTIWSDSWWRM